MKISLAQKGRVHSKIHNRKISQTLKRKYRSGEVKLKNQIQKHHVDMNHNNIRKSNIMVLTDSQHRKIHAWGYNYLVETGQIKNYIKWFKRKFL